MILARLTARSLARHRGLVVGMAAVLAGFQVLLVLIAVNVQRQGLFSVVAAMVPQSFQAALGGSFATFAGFVAFGFFHPVVLLALAVGAAFLASELARDVEDGLVDLLAARPVSRVIFVARSALAPGIAAAVTIALMVAANRASTLLYLPAGASAPRLVVFFWLAANLVAVTWSCGAIGLATASVARKRATAAGSTALTCIALYLLNFAATWWAPARPFARLAPFHYYDAMSIVLGTHNPTRDIVGLVAASLLLVVLACVMYNRRDL